MKEDKNRLSWWYPKIPSHIPCPRTTVIPYTGDNLINLLDGKDCDGFQELVNRLVIAGDMLGWPFFLRTDFLSGKHCWKDTCFVTDKNRVPEHIVNLVYESAMAGMMGFPTDFWIAREMIPTSPAFYAFWGNMPITKERRYFVQDDKVICHHPYWPGKAFKGMSVSTDDWPELLDEMNYESEDEVGLLSGLSSSVGAKIGGSWSIDWLWSEKKGQWFLTDMAESWCSYHWPGCPNEEKF